MSDEKTPYSGSPTSGGPRGPAPTHGAPPPPPGGYPPYAYPPYPPYPPPKTSGTGLAGRVLTGVLSSLFLLSLLGNVYFFILFAASQKADHNVVHDTYQAGDPAQRITILPVEGMITEETFNFVHDAIGSLEKRLPQALILRVDSGGGAVGACDRIWNELDRFRTNHPNIPVVASFGSVSASGGYYISTRADHIMAEPVCITGSIGVIFPGMTLEGLLEKVGVTPETIVADGSPQKHVANDIFRAWTPEDRAKVKQMLNAAHDRFVEVVEGGFDLRYGEGQDDGKPSREHILALADGSVFTTQQAEDNRLIDSQGYLDDAIATAKSLAGIPVGATPEITMIQPMRGLALLLTGASEQPRSFSQIDGQRLRQWVIEAATPRLEYRFDLVQP